MITSIQGRGDAHMTSQQYGCPKKTCKMKTSADTPVLMEDISQASWLDKEL